MAIITVNKYTLFYGDLEEAIDYENQNVKIDSGSESEENQFDMASNLTNSDSRFKL